MALSFARDRAVASLVPDVELEADRHFFAGLDAVADRLALVQTDAAPFIQGELRIDQIAVILQEPPDPHHVAVEDLFVGFKNDNDVAVGLEAFLPEPDQIGDKSRRHEFIVTGAAAVEVPILLRELKGVVRPVLTAGRNDVDMSQQQDRA